VKKLIILVMSLLAISVPAMSFACHVTEITGDADCFGWSQCTNVYFTSSVDEGSLTYTVTILDGDGTEVTSFGETQTVSHDPGAGIYEFCFSGDWVGDYEVTNATVVISVVFDDDDPEVFTFDLACSVDNEGTSWSGLKAQYR